MNRTLTCRGLGTLIVGAGLSVVATPAASKPLNRAERFFMGPDMTFLWAVEQTYSGPEEAVSVWEQMPPEWFAEQTGMIAEDSGNWTLPDFRDSGWDAGSEWDVYRWDDDQFFGRVTQLVDKSNLYIFGAYMSTFFGYDAYIRPVADWITRVVTAGLDVAEGPKGSYLELGGLILPKGETA